MPSTSELLEAALTYARLGWHVFPCEAPASDDPKSGKAPHGGLVPHGKDDATTDPTVITGWWARVPDANIGINVERSGLVVLDVDIGTTDKPKNGRTSLAALDSELTPTITAITGGGGLHAFYARHAGDPPVQMIGFRDGLDLIGNGYVIAAPSRHYTGGVYAWTNHGADVAPLPEVLRHIQRVPKTIEATAAITPIVEGGRNDALFKLGAALRGTGIGEHALRAALTFENARRFTPPLPDAEVQLVARSVMTRVHPERDVALGAVVSRDFAEMFPDGSPAPHESIARADELVGSIYASARLPVVHLPFEKLDEKLGGLSLHSITNLIAGTGKGKSSLAGQLSAHHATHAAAGGGPVIYYVGEMTRELVAARVAGQLLKRSWYDVLHGLIPEAEIRAALISMPLYFVKRSANPIDSIVSALKRAQDEGVPGIPMIVIDYVQLLAAVGVDMRVSTMSAVRQVQQLIEDVPVIGLVISQSSRGGASRIRAGAADSEELGDVGAETGELERSATNQLVLSFASKDDVEEHEVTMMVTKSRFGGGSKFGFRFNGRTGLWTPLARVPQSSAHEQKCAEILIQIEAHANGRCLDGHPCGKLLNKERFRDSSSPHRVSGTPKDLGLALDSLVDLKQILMVSGEYNLAAKGVT